MKEVEVDRAMSIERRDRTDAVPYLQSNYRESCLASTELGLSLSIGVAFLLLSTRAQRRHVALFLVNCLSIVCVVTNSLIRMRYSGVKINDRLGGGVGVEVAQLSVAYDFFSIFTPLVADSTLAFKLAILFPPWYGWKRTVVLGIFAMLCFARLVAAACIVWQGTVYYVAPTRRGLAFWQLDASFQPFIMLVNAPIQLATCAFASSLLFHRAHAFARAVTRREPKRQLRFFIESTTMTFLPPVLCQIIILVALSAKEEQLALLRAAMWAEDLNMIFSLIFSILATSWSTIRSPLLTHDATDTSTSHEQPSSASSGAQERKEPAFASPVMQDSILGTVLTRAGMVGAPAGQDESVMEVMVTLPSRANDDVAADDVEYARKFGTKLSSPQQGRWLRPV